MTIMVGNGRAANRSALHLLTAYYIARYTLVVAKVDEDHTS